MVTGGGAGVMTLVAGAAPADTVAVMRLEQLCLVVVVLMVVVRHVLELLDGGGGRRRRMVHEYGRRRASVVHLVQGRQLYGRQHFGGRVGADGRVDVALHVGRIGRGRNLQGRRRKRCRRRRRRDRGRGRGRLFGLQQQVL